LENIALAIQMACKTISNLVHRAGLNYDDTKDDVVEDDASSEGKKSSLSEDYADGRYYSMKRLDKLSTNVLKNALKFTGTVNMMVPTAKIAGEKPHHHQPGTLIAYDEHYLACLDPLDGSGNADASICTGTVFGIFRRDDGDVQQPPDERTILQPAKNMRAAGYCLYSSATVLVFTFQDGVYGFTLDPQIQEFVLTHDNLTIPDRGTVYSCNEANSEGWREPWKKYLKALKLGQGETQTRYAHRYVGSMVGDIHRTLLYGGLFAYPSAQHKPKGNLQLLYKTAPMAFVVHHAGGKALDEEGNDLLDKRPERIHQKSPCFMGSPGDVDELKKYLLEAKEEDEIEEEEEEKEEKEKDGE
jgi:fructose-1,6-bisphosphatase I